MATHREVFQEKMDNLFANSGDTNQMQQSAASDLGLHGLPITLLGVSGLKRVKKIFQYVVC